MGLGIKLGLNMGLLVLVIAGTGARNVDKAGADVAIFGGYNLGRKFWEA